MKKKLIAFALIVVSLATIMFAEYRYIMLNLQPYYTEDGFLCIEIFGNTDAYYAE